MMTKPLVMENTLFYQNSHLWLHFAMGLLRYYASWRAFQTEKKPYLPSFSKAKDPSPEDEADRIDSNPSPDGKNGNLGNGRGNNVFGDEISDGGETDDDSDDSSSSGGQGSDDSGGEEGEDSGDDDCWDNESDKEEEDEEKSDYSASSDEDEEDIALLIHARKVYRPSILRVFEHEYQKSRALMVDVTDEDYDERGLVFKYSLHKMRPDESYHDLTAYPCAAELSEHGIYRIGRGEKEHELTAHPCEGEMNCSCNFFSNFGILCCHALLVLRCLHIDEIPDRHLIKWMMKDNCNGVVEEESCKRRRLMPAGCSTKSIIAGVCKDDITTVYQEREKDIYKKIVQIDFKFLKRASTFDPSVIYGFLQKEQPTATKDDCYTAYREKKKRTLVESTREINSPILLHAKDIYIPEIFSLFHAEFKKSEYLHMSIVSQKSNESGNRILLECELYRPGHRGRNLTVFADSFDGTVKCSCEKFNLDGILCSHAVAVLTILCIVRIPAQYILPQFVRDSRFCNKGEIHGASYEGLLRFARFKMLQDEMEEICKMAEKCSKVRVAFENLLTETRADLEGRADTNAGTSEGTG